MVEVVEATTVEPELPEVVNAVASLERGRGHMTSARWQEAIEEFNEDLYTENTYWDNVVDIYCIWCD